MSKLQVTLDDKIKEDGQISTQTLGTVHTYTAQSHENLLLNLSKAAAEQTDLITLSRENRRLKQKLETAEAELKERYTQIQLLEHTISEIKYKGYGRVDERESHVVEKNQYLVELYDNGNDDEDILSYHFSEVIRRHHDVLAKKDQQIKELQEGLTRCERKVPPNQPEQQMWSHDYCTQAPIDTERLRRTEAAVKVFKKGLDLVKNQLNSRSLAETCSPCSPRDEAVIRELEKRRNFGVIADIEKMGEEFMRRLQLEEKIDQFHWNIEKRRHQRVKDEAGDDFDPKCSFNKEFEMLEITRHNLLKALGDLKAKVKIEVSATNKEVDNRDKLKDNSFKTTQILYIAPDERRPTMDNDHHVHFEDDVHVNTIQILYAPYNNSHTECKQCKSNH